MNDLEKAIEIYNKRVAENPKYPQEVIDEWREDMPEQFTQFMFESEYGCHIIDKSMYDEAVGYLKYNGGTAKGAKWDVDTITQKADIDFDKKDYYPLDYAYVVNMLYSDYSDSIGDDKPSVYFNMAKNYLEDNDYWGDASERGYKNAKKRIKYNRLV